MKRFPRLPLYLCLAATLFAAAAHGDTFRFQIAGGQVSGSGYLNAIPDAGKPGAFDVTSIAGSLTLSGISKPITGLLPCASYSVSTPCGNGLTFGYDNLLFPAGVPPFDIVQLDYRGIGFLLGSEAAETYGSSSHQSALYFNGEPSQVPPDHISFTVAATPEPGSFFLLGSGLVFITISLRRRLSGLANLSID